jgi:hypothetical protein
MKWAMTCYVLGGVVAFTIAVLFIPVARGSPILRLMDVPFEQAIKYHRWFGYLTVVLVFVHGATLAVALGGVHKIRLVRVLLVPSANPELDFQIAEALFIRSKIMFCQNIICNRLIFHYEINFLRVLNSGLLNPNMLPG